MGFIGAGTILRDGFHVKGLTTAASLLAVTGIGLLLGCGAYVTAIIATLIVYVILSYTHFMSSGLDKFSRLDLELVTSGNPKDLVKQVQKITSKEEIAIKNMKIEDNSLIITGRATEDVDLLDLKRKLLEIRDVEEVIDNNL